MNRFCALTFLCLAAPSLWAQDISKPLTEGELLKNLDSFATGDPLHKQPLSVGDDKPAKTETAKKGVAKKEKGATEITALEATFDNKKHQAIFLGQVLVKDPEFTVNCDRLTAFLKHEAEKTPEAAKAEASGKAKTEEGAKPAPVPKVEAKSGEPSKSGKEGKSGAGGLEKAIAEASGTNRVVVVQEKTETDGSVNRNVGQGRKVVFENESGDITFTGMPTVQQGFNTCVATDESTIMILNREGRMRVTGPHKTVIRDTSAEASAARK